MNNYALDETGNGVGTIVIVSRGRLTNAVIADNDAETGVAGVVALRNAIVDVYNATIVNNGNDDLTSISGADLYVTSGATVSLHNTIVGVEDGTSENSVDCVVVDRRGTLKAEYTLSADADVVNAGETNIAYDGSTIFVGDSDYEYDALVVPYYALVPNDLAVNAGNNEYVTPANGYGAEGEQYDVVGNARVADEYSTSGYVAGVVDLGAYESGYKEDGYENGFERPSIVVTTLDDVVDPYDGWISLREAAEVYFHYRELEDGSIDVEARYYEAAGGLTITFDLADYYEAKLEEAQEAWLEDHDDLEGFEYEPEPYNVITLAGKEITVKDSMTIDATSVKIADSEWDERMTVSANEESRVFVIEGAATNAPSLTLNALDVTQGYGAGIELSEGSNVVLNDSSVTYTVGGAGIVGKLNTAIRLNNGSVVAHNANTNGYGGGISAPNGAVYIDGATISENTAVIGGGIYAANIYANRATISGNVATGAGSQDALGGAIVVVSRARLTNSLVVRNDATPTEDGYVYGGIVALRNAIVDLYNATIVENVAAPEPVDERCQCGCECVYCRCEGHMHDATPELETTTVDVYALGATLTSYNSIVGLTEGAIQVESVGSRVATATAYNTLSAFTAWTNASETNVAYDGEAPIFDAESAIPYMIASDGLAANAGDVAYVTESHGYGATDLAGAKRVQGESVDLGAYESVSPFEDPSIIVTTLDDVVDPTDNLISLREAVEVYFAQVEGATITFADELAGGTITLTDGQITISESMTIDGASAITIDAASRSRVFYVAGEFDAETGKGDVALDVTFNGLTIQNGSTSAYADAIEGTYANKIRQDGAGIDAINANVTITNATFENNVAAERGGAVSVNGGSLVMENVVLTNNEAVAKSGGAVIVETAASASFTNVTATGNKASGKLGGALYLSKVEATISDSEFSENVAKIGGGAIYATGVDLTISGATFDANAANGGSYGGGALYARDSSVVTIADSSFTSNATKFSGGAITANANTTIVVATSSFAGNVAALDGGAIYANEQTSKAQASTIVVTDSSFTNNSATRYGGAVFASELAMDRAVVTGNAGPNGAISATGGAATLANTLVAENTGRYGVIARSGAQVEIVNATIVNNEGTDLFTTGNATVVTLENVITALDASKIGSNGGALVAYNTLSAYDAWTDGANNYVYESGMPLFGDGYELAEDSVAVNRGNAAFVADYEFDLNGAARVQGGFVDLGAYESLDPRETASLVVTTTADVVDPFDGEISLREAVENYFGIAAGTTITFASDLAGKSITLDAPITLRESMALDATALEGGVTITSTSKSRLFVVSDVDVEFAGLTLAGGKAEGESGGAISATNANLTFRQSALTGNASTGNGGAIAATGGSLKFVSATVANNVGNSGGAIYAKNATVTAAQTTFEGNQGTIGGAVYLQGGSGEFVETTFTSNTASSNGNSYGGGALYALDADVTLTDATFTSNVASASKAGAALVMNGALTITGTTFEGNTSKTHGGAIFAKNAKSIHIATTTFAENIGSEGGALFLTGSNATIENSTFELNETSVGSLGGGAIYFQSTGATKTLALTATDFLGNKGGRYGGAISAANGAVEINGGVFEGNASTIGAGLYAKNATTTIVDAIFAENTAAANSAVLWLYSGSAQLKNVVFEGNTGKNYGGQLNALIEELADQPELSGAVIDDAFAELFADDFDLEIEF